VKNTLLQQAQQQLVLQKNYFKKGSFKKSGSKSISGKRQRMDFPLSLAYISPLNGQRLEEKDQMFH